MTMIYFCCTLYVASLNEPLTRNVKLLRAIFLVSSISTVLCYPLIRWKLCITRNPVIGYVIYSTFSFSYGASCTAWCILLYLSIIKVFIGTSFSISNCIQKMYRILFVIQVLCVLSMLMTTILFGALTIYFRFLAVFSLLLYIFTVMSLTILFIQRLVVVYMNTDNQRNQGLVSSVTRLTILISLSTITSLFLIIIQSLRAVMETELTEFLVHSVGLINLYTNFVSAMLTNKMFDSYYKKLCGALDMKCKKCWIRILDADEVETRLSEMIDTGSKPETASVKEQLSVLSSTPTTPTSHSM